MVRWLRWHCPPDTGFEIRALAVWGRARYLSVTEAPHNTNFHTWMGKKQFCFSQTAETGNRTPDSGVKGSGANHYPRAPALLPGCWLLVKILSSRKTDDELSSWHRCCLWQLNPFSPHDALKHRFTSLKTDLIFLKQRVLERKFPWNWFTDTWWFTLIFKPHQIIFIHCKSRIATAIRGL